MIKSYGIVNDRSPHIIADLFEIMAFFERREVSRGDIETYLMNEAGRGFKEEVEEEVDAAASSAEKNEKFQLVSEESFLHFQYRKKAFGKWYPFEAEADVLTPVKKISDRMKVYISLLVYSRLKMLSASDRTKFAAHFEKLCVESLKGLFPGWSVIHFGKGGADRAALGNRLSDAIRGLAKNLKDSADEHYIGKITPHDTGDAGIDIVALYDFADPAPGVTAFFAQCAAQQTAWPEKRFEANSVSLRQYVNFFHSPGAMLLIPVFYRNTDGNWVTEDGYGSVLIDRLRLVNMIESQKPAALAAALATVPDGLIPAEAAA